MQQGDLQLWIVPRWIVVLEGVLAKVTPVVKKSRLRGSRITGYHTQWYDIPLKRVVYLKEKWPDASLEIVTFIGQDFLDNTLEFLDDAQIPYDRAYYNSLDGFCAVMRFQNDLQRIYDSDVDRLDRFGQYGVAVVPGFDF